MRILVISPHYDDAPLSLGQSLLDGELSRHRVTVGIVFGRTNWVRYFFPKRRRMPIATAIRLGEEIRNAWRFRFRLRIGRFEEVILRLDSPESAAFLDPSFDAAAAPEIAGITELIARWAEHYDVVLVPCGVGDHVDHRLCAEAGVRLARTGTRQVGFYEDRPYACWLGDDAIAAAPARLGLPLEVRDVSGPIAMAKQELIWYPSQFDSSFLDAMAGDIGSARHERIWVQRDANWPPRAIDGSSTAARSCEGSP